MAKIRVAHIISASMGVRFILLNQLVYLKNKGYEVTSISSPGKWMPDIKKRGIKIKNIKIYRSFNPFKDLISLINLFFYLRKEKFNIVHTHTPKAGFLGRIAARLAKIPIIVHTNPGFYFHNETKLVKKKFYVGLEKLAAKCCHLILSQNTEDIDTAIKAGICSAEKIKLLGNGIDLERFNPKKVSSRDIEEKKKELGIAEEEKVVGIMGRLVKEKGFIEFVEAAQIVKKKIANIKFLAVGPMEKDKNDKITGNNILREELAGNIIFLSQMRMDVPELLSIMDVVTLPSYREGMPRIPMEAGAMQKPVVVTNIRGCREVVKNNETGIVIPVKDSISLAKAIIYLLEHKEEAHKMGMNGQKRVKELFDETKIFPKIDKAYQALLKKQ